MIVKLSGILYPCRKVKYFIDLTNLFHGLSTVVHVPHQLSYLSCSCYTRACIAYKLAGSGGCVIVPVTNPSHMEGGVLLEV